MRNLTEWQTRLLRRRAEAAGYDGDFADLLDDEREVDGDVDLYDEQPDEYDRLEPAALVYAAGALLFVAMVVGLVLLPAVQR